MYSIKTTIVNKTGLHARPAAAFVAQANRYRCDIRIRNLETNKESNAKSMILLMALGLTQGTRIELNVEGEDEQRTAHELKELIESGFGEAN